MPKKIAIVEDEAELAALIEYNLVRHGYEAQVAGRLEGHPARAGAGQARSDSAGRHAARCRWLRAVPADPAIRGTGAHAGAVPDGAVRRSGPGAGTGNRRRRLHDQAVQPARTDRAREGASAPRGDGCRAAADGDRSLPPGSHGAPHVPGRARNFADFHRVQPAGVLPDPSGARLQPGPASGSGVGRIALRHAAHGGRARAPPARADRRTARTTRAT